MLIKQLSQAFMYVRIDGCSSDQQLIAPNPWRAFTWCRELSAAGTQHHHNKFPHSPSRHYDIPNRFEFPRAPNSILLTHQHDNSIRAQELTEQADNGRALCGGQPPEHQLRL